MNDLIYNQHTIPKDELRYGLRASADIGCGWIAVYNALCILGKPADKKELIRYFERQLPLIHGIRGTSFWGPAVFFRQRGYKVTVEVRRDRFDALAAEKTVCVLYYYWRNGRKINGHFVALHKTEQGFVGYNTDRNSTGPELYGPSLDAFLKKRGFFGCFLAAIEE